MDLGNLKTKLAEASALKSLEIPHRNRTDDDAQRNGVRC